MFFFFEAMCQSFLFHGDLTRIFYFNTSEKFFLNRYLSVNTFMRQQNSKNKGEKCIGAEYLCVMNYFRYKNSLWMQREKNINIIGL